MEVQTPARLFGTVAFAAGPGTFVVQVIVLLMDSLVNELKHKVCLCTYLYLR
jgi:hypothetical protein